MQLSIIIVNYNVKYFLEQCLHSVLNACKNIHVEIFVVDNHSTDSSRIYLESKFPVVYFKWNSQNIGFGKANNSVLKEAKGEHILFLNPDTIVPEDCFEKCLSFFYSNKDCGALGVRMVDGSGNFLKESKRSFPSLLPSFFKITGFARAFPSSKIFAKYYAGHLPEKKNNEVDVLAGAFMMLSKKALDKVPGFDEHFFMYGEDIDLSYRVVKAGFKNYYLADTSIIHFKGESTQKATPDYIKHFYGAMLLFVKKHYRQNKAAYFFSIAAIRFSKLLAEANFILTQLFPKIFLPSSKRSNTQKTIIVGSGIYVNEVAQLIKFSQKPLIIQDLVEVDSKCLEGSRELMEAINAIIDKNVIDKIVFCQSDGCKYIYIIRIIQDLKAGIDFLFHAHKSNSIVGSSSKNKKGIFIPL